jgi:hypothetical protein
MSVSFYSAAQDLRSNLIHQLDHLTRALAMDSEAGEYVSGNGPAAIQTGLSVLNETMTWYEKLVTQTYNGRAASYAARDLPEDEQTAYRNTRHQLKVLNALYGPKKD